MLCRVSKEHKDDRLLLVDWSVLDKHWASPPNRDSLLNKYLWLWFSSVEDELWFEVPIIGWRLQDSSVSFVNGRNRTALITKRQPLIPIAVDNNFLDIPICQKSIIQELSVGDSVKLPDLPILTHNEWLELLR